MKISNKTIKYFSSSKPFKIHVLMTVLVIVLTNIDIEEAVFFFQVVEV